MEYIKSKLEGRELLLEQWLGKNVEELQTPSIVAEIDILQKNLVKMDSWFEEKDCNLRPHFKSHKCVELARRQTELPNTVGITCAKTSEAEQLVKGGIVDVLIANQVIGMDKVRRIARINLKAKVRVVVDSLEGIRQLSIAAKETGVTIGVLVEVDIGMNRGGVLHGEPVIKLAKIISEMPNLSFDGMQSYEGHIVTLENYRERKLRVEEAMAPLIETKRTLEALGYSLFISSGGTGTYDITGNIEEIDELQCGSYVLMDAAYKKIRPEFKNARYILSTVISKRGNTITTDVGLKGMGAEYAMPVIVGNPKANVLYVAEEHTVMENVKADIGDKIRLIPPHGCTTNNLHERMWIARNDVIEDIWLLEGRGCLE
jgi:D-serine deaminase-like pyridoxal phosphate-dependent protein